MSEQFAFGPGGVRSVAKAVFTPDAADARDPSGFTSPEVSLPRVLLVSEAPAAIDAQGASKTLRALFGTYPGPLRLVTQGSVAREDDGLDRAAVRDRVIPRRLNRVGPRTAELRERLDFQVITRFGSLRWVVAGFRPDVVIVCPLGKWGVAVGAAAARFARAPLITYFMDDWPGTIAPYPEVARLLQVADAWLVISDRLREVFVTRYRSIAPPTLVVHNPARPSRGRSAVGDAIRSTAASTNSAGPFTVVYAGSIQPMHFDALVATARAIADLRGRGVRSKLVVHTHPSFWTAHESVWRDLGVENGGLISHALLEARLRDADLLLVVASFLPTHAPMSQSSVQTKLTDYMAAGRPIFGVGPAGAASLEFIERWKLGVTCTAPEPQSIAAALEKWMATGVARESFERTAHEALKMHFDPDVVCPKLWQFVANVALRSPNLASAPSNDRA